MIHVAVLAGGQSRRMGRDKALLPLGGQTLIERVLAAAHPLGYPRVIIGDPTAYAHFGLPVHPDRRPSLGPLGGLYTALSTTATPVLLLACDLPFLTPDFLRHLVNRRGPHQAVVPHTATGLQPLCALLRAVLLSRCRSRHTGRSARYARPTKQSEFGFGKRKRLAALRRARPAFCQSQRARRVRASASRTPKIQHPPRSTPTIAAGRRPKP